jgi:hypothetical protein
MVHSPQSRESLKSTLPLRGSEMPVNTTPPIDIPAAIAMADYTMS